MLQCPPLHPYTQAGSDAARAAGRGSSCLHRQLTHPRQQKLPSTSSWHVRSPAVQANRFAVERGIQRRWMATGRMLTDAGDASTANVEQCSKHVSTSVHQQSHARNGHEENLNGHEDSERSAW
eukprot:251187-Chlamydomonas_euryale.AAC.2